MCVDVHVSARVCVDVHVCAHVYMLVYVNESVYVRVCVCVLPVEGGRGVVTSPCLSVLKLPCAPPLARWCGQQGY